MLREDFTKDTRVIVEGFYDPGDMSMCFIKKCTGYVVEPPTVFSKYVKIEIESGEHAGETLCVPMANCCWVEQTRVRLDYKKFNDKKGNNKK